MELYVVTYRPYEIMYVNVYIYIIIYIFGVVAKGHEQHV